MNLATIIQYKFPDVDMLSQVQVRDDGNGPYIYKWDESLGPKPDQNTLSQWEQEVDLLYRQEAARKIRKRKYKPKGDQLDAILKQLNYWRLNGQPLVQDADDIVNHWLNVKEENPIPEA